MEEDIEYWICLDHPCYGADVWAIDKNSPEYSEYSRTAKGQGYVPLLDVRALWNANPEPAAAEAEETDLDTMRWVAKFVLGEHDKLRIKYNALLDAEAAAEPGEPLRDWMEKIEAWLKAHDRRCDYLAGHLATLEALAGYGQRAERGEGEAQRG